MQVGFESDIASPRGGVPPIDPLNRGSSDAKDRLGLSALLVRPDGFVAWASDTTP
jgi:hypothetical protein